MKKSFKTIILSVAGLSFLVAFGFVLAQPIRQNDCCVISSTIKLKGIVDGVEGNASVGKGDVVVSANAGYWCDLDGDDSNDTNNTIKADGSFLPLESWGLICALSAVNRVINWLFYIITLIVVLMVIYGGFVIITASGDPTKAGKGRSIITYAMIGVAVAILARIIPSVVQYIMGV